LVELSGALVAGEGTILTLERFAPLATFVT
jgi:hypothetical protein